MERSVYIIKPEVVANREQIRALIRRSGLRIVSHKLVVLPQHAIESLYPGINDDLHAATLYYFGVGPCEIGIVEGNNAIERLSRLAGDSVSPAQCDPSTIRSQFGFRDPVKWGSASYFLNGLHRSKEAGEVARDLELFDALPEATALR